MADEQHRYRVVLRFNAPVLSVATLRWVVRMIGDRDAPKGLRVRFERDSE